MNTDDFSNAISNLMLQKGEIQRKENLADVYPSAQSTQFMPNRHEAERSAVRSAAQQLLPRIQAYLTDWKGQDDLVGAIQNQIDQREGIIYDRFAQKLKRPYGDIWTEHILIDASPKKLQIMASRINKIPHAQQLNRLSKIGSIIGLIVLILVVYLFLNMATKGYYTWSLRIAGVVCLVAVAWLFVR